MSTSASDVAAGPPDSLGFESEAERVAGRLRDQIIDGARPAGSRLVERDIAAEMGVSRIPVRDALKALVAEGLATPRPRTWAVVRTFTEADVADLLEVRSALETLAFRLAAQRRSDEELASLGRLVAAEQRVAAAGDAPAARRAGTDFHELVVAMAHNDLLTELFATTRSRMRWLLGQHGDLAEMADEHAALHGAIADGDPDRAAELAQAHLITSRRAALRHAGIDQRDSRRPSGGGDDVPGTTQRAGPGGRARCERWYAIRDSNPEPAD